MTDTNTAVADVPVTLALVEKEGSTRGKNPRKITYKVLNMVPKTVAEFMAVTGVNKEADIAEVLYEGFNSSAYSAASDEIGEFINESWDIETQKQFRLAVRSFSKSADVSIEDAVNLIKPGVEKGFLARLEAAKVKAEAEKAAPAPAVA